MRLGVKLASNQWVKPTGTTLRSGGLPKALMAKASEGFRQGSREWLSNVYHRPIRLPAKHCKIWKLRVLVPRAMG